MTDIRRVGDSGIHTVEGNIAGSRAAFLTKKRDKEAAEYEAEKNKIKEQNAAGVGRIDDKFNAATDSLEQEFRRRTVGLVTAEDFRKARELVVDVVQDGEKKQREREEEASQQRKKDRALKRKKMASTLSFTVDDDEDEGGGAASITAGNDKASSSSSISTATAAVSSSSSSSAAPSSSSCPSAVLMKKLKKDPTIDCSFLPDRDRDRAQQEERERLRLEWLKQQGDVKNEVRYSDDAS